MELATIRLTVAPVISHVHRPPSRVFAPPDLGGFASLDLGMALLAGWWAAPPPGSSTDGRSLMVNSEWCECSIDVFTDSCEEQIKHSTPFASSIGPPRLRHADTLIVMSAFGAIASLPVRTYEEEQKFLRQVAPCEWHIAQGFVPNMQVPGNSHVQPASGACFLELQQYCKSSAQQGFLPALKQIANVAALPGIVRHSIGLPDVHSGYGFAIGNVRL